MAAHQHALNRKSCQKYPFQDFTNFQSVFVASQVINLSPDIRDTKITKRRWKGGIYNAILLTTEKCVSYSVLLKGLTLSFLAKDAGDHTFLFLYKGGVCRSFWILARYPFPTYFWSQDKTHKHNYGNLYNASFYAPETVRLPAHLVRLMEHMKRFS